MRTDKTHTVVPQELSLSSLSSASGLSIGLAIQEQRSSVACAKITPFEGKITEFKLVKKKNRGNKIMSQFWQFFHLYENRDNRPTKLDEDKDYACCNICGMDLVCGGKSGSTGGIRNHIHGRHPEMLPFVTSSFGGSGRTSDSTTDGSKKRMAGIKEAFDRQKVPKFVKRSEKDEYCATMTARWIAMEDMPLDTVENERFREMIAAHDADAKPIHNRKVHEKIRYFETNIHAAITKSLSVDGQWVALTTDHWTSIAKQSYCGMTAHWIDSDFNMHNKTLGCWLHEGNSITNSLRDEFLLNLFTRYKFDKLNIVAVVSDTTGNMNKFGMKLQEQNIPHIYCTDHVIQLTAKKAYMDEFYNIAHGGAAGNDNDDDEDLPPAHNNLQAEISTMAKARTLVEFFSRSNQSTEALKKQQAAMNHYSDKVPVGVIVDVVTRWWSTWSMCNRLLHLKNALQALEHDGAIPPDKILLSDDWDVIKEVSDLLLPFKSAQKLLEGEKYVTISWIPTALKGILSKLEAIINAPVDPQTETTSKLAVRNLAKVLLKDFSARWLTNGANTFHFDGSVHRGWMNRQVGVHPAVAIATVLDPRFKLLNGFDNNDDKVRIWDALLAEMILRADKGTVEEEQETDDENPRGNQEPACCPVPDADDDDIAFFIDQNTEANANNNMAQQEHAALAGGIRERCEMELAAYRQLPSLLIRNEKKENNDPLKWWRDRQTKLPILAMLARMYLCIPATSAPSERIFSMASRLINKRRARLTPENAGRMIFVNRNLGWYEEEHGLII
jgi:hypothetical protein